MPLIENTKTGAIEKFKAGMAFIWNKNKKPVDSSEPAALRRACSESNLLSAFKWLKNQDHTEDSNENINEQDSRPTFQRINVKVKRVLVPSRTEITPVKSSLRRRTTDSELVITPSQRRKSVTFSMYALILSAASQNLLSELKNILDTEPSFINKPSSSGETALHKAAAKGNFDCVKLLVERGADVNLADKRGRTPLFIAWEKEHFECHKFMLSSLRQKCEGKN